MVAAPAARRHGAPIRGRALGVHETAAADSGGGRRRARARRRHPQRVGVPDAGARVSARRRRRRRRAGARGVRRHVRILPRARGAAPRRHNEGLARRGRVGDRDGKPGDDARTVRFKTRRKRRGARAEADVASARRRRDDRLAGHRVGRSHLPVFLRAAPEGGPGRAPAGDDRQGGRKPSRV